MLAETRARFKGKFVIEHFRNEQKIGEYDLDNGIVDVGMNKLLDVQFHADTAITTWYIALIDNAGFSALANADTMASHAGWAESVAYSDATRVAWVEGAAAARSITNPTSSDFNINATATLKGIFVTSVNVKSGTTGTLWATALFSATVPVVNGDVLKITYTVSG